MGLNFVTVYN